MVTELEMQERMRTAMEFLTQQIAKVHLVKMEQMVQTVLQGKEVHKENKESKEFQDKTELMVQMELQEKEVHKGKEVFKESKEFQDRMELTVQTVLQGKEVLRENKVSKD